MLLNFRVKNFKNFAEDVELNMLASSIKEHSESLIDANGVKVLPIASFFGANGCGKSNFMEAFAVMHDLILGLGKKDQQSGLKELITPFIFNKNNLGVPTEFEITVYDSSTKKEYRYGFSATKQKIMEEWLFIQTFSTTKNLKEKCIFYREDGETLKSDINNSELKEIDFVNSLTKNDELLLTNIGKRRSSKYAFVFNWIEGKNIFINYSDESNYSFYSNDAQSIFDLLYSEQDILDEVASFLNVIDDSIHSVVIKKEMDNQMNTKFTPYSVHYDDENNRLEIPFTSESCGTRKMLVLMFHLFYALVCGRTIFADELDSKLHPLILRRIVRMFRDKKQNIGGGQLIFTSHNLICLDSSDLRRDEIWFIEKKNQRATLFSLYDFKETNVRNDLSFGKHYLNGRFGAVPFLKK